MSNIVNLTNCNEVLAFYRLKEIKRDEKVKLQPKDLEKIIKMAKSTKEISNKLIINLSLQSVNKKLRKNEIMELNNKDLALLAHLPTLLLKNQSSDFFAYPFGIIFPNLCQPFLSTKNSKKDTLESKIKDTAYLASLLNFGPEDTKLDTFPSQSHGFLLILNNASKTLALIMAPTLLLKLEAPEPDSSIQYKTLF